MQMFTEGITEFSYKINYLLISSFKALPGLNLGVLEAASGRRGGKPAAG